VDGSGALIVVTKLVTWSTQPLSLAALALAAAVLWPGVPRGPRVGCALALALLWGGGCRLAAERVAGALERRSVSAPPDASAEAIVVLGGGTRPALGPRRGPELNEAGDRVLEAARLWREGRAPRVVASGGRPDGGPAEAGDAAALLRFLGVAGDAIMEEPLSRTTRENAIEVRRLLEPHGVRRILLVTSALHMPRAAAHFRSEGFEVLQAPTDWIAVEEPPRTQGARLLRLLPTAEALTVTTRALREWLALAAARALGSLRPPGPAPAARRASPRVAACGLAHPGRAPTWGMFPGPSSSGVPRLSTCASST